MKPKWTTEAQRHRGRVWWRELRSRWEAQTIETIKKGRFRPDISVPLRRCGDSYVRRRRGEESRLKPRMNTDESKVDHRDTEAQREQESGALVALMSYPMFRRELRSRREDHESLIHRMNLGLLGIPVPLCLCGDPYFRRSHGEELIPRMNTDQIADRSVGLMVPPTVMPARPVSGNSGGCSWTPAFAGVTKGGFARVNSITPHPLPPLPHPSSLDKLGMRRLRMRERKEVSLVGTLS
jgi:hypothetical protein